MKKIVALIFLVLALGGGEAAGHNRHGGHRGDITVTADTAVMVYMNSVAVTTRLHILCQMIKFSMKEMKSRAPRRQVSEY